MVLTKGSTIVLPESVRLIMPVWPTFAMRWDEVERAETDQDGNQIVLHGPGKRMTLPGPWYWQRADQELGEQAFIGHLERVNVPVRTSAAAAYTAQRHACVQELTRGQRAVEGSLPRTSVLPRCTPNSSCLRHSLTHLAEIVSLLYRSKA